MGNNCHMTERRFVMKILRKTVCYLLVILMLMTSVPLAGIEAVSYDDYFDEYQEVTEGYYTYYVYNNEVVISSVDNGIKGSIVIPSELGGYPVTVIGYGAFSNCDHITIVEIPSTVKVIGDEAFSYCDNLTNVIIPESVKEIGVGAFYECTSLVSVDIPSSVTEISNSLFSGCGNLIEVKLPDTIKTIGYSAFCDCDSLTEMVIPEGVKSILGNVFYSCGSLAKVEIADTVETIGYSAFEECNVLVEVYIPSSVKTIEEDAFNECIKLENIFVDADNTSYCDVDGVLYNKLKTELVCYPIGNQRNEYKILEGTEVIHDYSFEDSVYLETVEIPESMIKVGYGAFEDSYKLHTVKFLGQNVTEIGSYAFADCYVLKNVTIPYGITEIKYSTFDDTAIEYMDIPSTVRTISDYAFAWCYNLKEVVMRNGLENIGEYAFYHCGDLKTVAIPETVINIEQYAFRCYGLEEIQVDKNNDYFSNDESGTLYNKEKTVLVQYPIGNDRKIFTVPDTVLRIKDGAFTDCVNLREVIIPEGVTNIGASSFESCYSLTDITIPNTITGIGYRAFYGCELTDVYFTGSEDEFKAITISEDNSSLLNARIHYNYGDSHAYTVIKKKHPTCGDSGLYIYNCTCGYSYEKTIPPEGDHIWNEWYVYYNPTCTEEGRNARECEVCGNEEYEIIPALGGEHSWGNWITDWFSCADGGEKYRYCSKCNDTEYDYLEPSGEHSFGEWELKRAADCGTMGREERNCTACGVVDTKYLPLVGEHKWSEWDEYDRATCTEQGREERYCKICYEYEYRVIPALGGEHNWGEWEFAWGSCVTGGEEERVCTVCNDYEYRNLTITGEHNWSEWEVEYEATCTHDGEKYRECTECDEYETEEIPALGGEHNWTEWTVYSEASCTTWGDYWRYCTVCDAQEWDGIEPSGHSYDQWFFDIVHMKMYRICHCGAAEGGNIESDSDEGVDIYYPENPDADFVIDEIKDKNDDVYVIVEEQFGSGVVKLYDINLVDGDGISIQPNGTVKVKLPHDGRAGEYKVYRVNDDGSYTDMNATTEGDRIVFLTDHFSYYVLVDVELATALPGDETDGHNHKYVVSEKVDADCTKDGKKVFACECGETYTETVKATGHTFKDGESECSNCDFDKSDSCDCNCHKSGIGNFFFKFILFFQKIFKSNKECSCGVNHY